MALKDIFTMVKADRYTADGREAIIKAQEAETEDKVYQIGEISQKTGLQKTANGWVKPKNGKQPGAKKEAEAALKKQNAAAGIKHPPKVMPKGMSPAEFEKAWEDDAKKHGFEKGQGYEWREYLRKEEEEGEASAKAFADKVHKGEIKYNEETGKFEERKTTESKPVDKEKLLDTLSFDLVDTTADIEEEYNAVEHSDNSRLPEFVRQEIERDYVNKANGEKWSDAEKDIIAEEVTRRIKQRQSKDAAPRVLTGDTKIRVRKA